MNDNASRLREAFETHERLAPDPAEVYAEVQRLARSYQRRRWGAQAAGGAVLSAGLIAGVITLPGLLPGTPKDNAAVAPVAATPSASAPVSEKELDAYVAAGYGYDEAVKLAELWKRTGDDIAQIKADAGRRLLAGETLPIAAAPSDDAPGSSPEDLQVEAFYKAGYSYDDAVQLAELWGQVDTYQAKIEGGKRLLAGETLPIKPTPEDSGDTEETKRVRAFFAAGYDYDDAVKLADLWGKSDAYQAKVEGGKRLLAGETLPIKP